MNYSEYVSHASRVFKTQLAMHILQANCWFMVSLIQECLGEVFFGCLAGRFIYTVLGDAIRRDIMATARLIIGFPHLEAVRIFHQLNIANAEHLYS
jgi:hypothetical protein